MSSVTFLFFSPLFCNSLPSSHCCVLSLRVSLFFLPCTSRKGVQNVFAFPTLTLRSHINCATALGLACAATRLACSRLYKTFWRLCSQSSYGSSSSTSKTEINPTLQRRQRDGRLPSRCLSSHWFNRYSFTSTWGCSTIVC